MTKKSFSKDFITTLLIKAKLTNEDGKVDADYVDRLAEQLDKKMGLFVMSKLSVDDLEAYYALVAKKATGEELNKFLQEKIPNFVEEQKKFFDTYAYNFFNRTAIIKETLKKE
jgi:hypothetical protein